jgi:radical SAM protein
MQMVRQPMYDYHKRPFLVIWEVTQACDLQCRHCRAESQTMHDPLALSLEDGFHLIEQVVALGDPQPMFILTGGDPFKHPQIMDLLGYTHQLGLRTAVSPSATPLLTYENLKRCKENGVRSISLSLDGSNAVLHDDFRQVDGSFDITVKGWKVAHDLGIKVQINTTVTRYNLLDLPKIFALVSELGAMTWSVFFLVPTGRGKTEDEVSPEDYEAILNFVYDASKYISAKTTEGHHYKRVVIQRASLERRGISPGDVMQLNGTYTQLRSDLDNVVTEREMLPRIESIHRKPMNINAADGFVFVSLKGDVYPSGYLPLKAGNIRDQTLGDIYQHSPLFKRLRDKEQLQGRCGICEFKRVCGGSRSRAYAVTGDVMAEEPFCIYRPGTFPFQEDIASLSGLS